MGIFFVIILGAMLYIVGPTLGMVLVRDALGIRDRRILIAVWLGFFTIIALTLAEGRERQNWPPTLPATPAPVNLNWGEKPAAPLSRPGSAVQYKG